MERTTLEKFFTGKLFRVPSYQRNYAWEPENVDDLWSDVKEALDLSTSHYLGTFILARRADEEAYKLVDGQQRLTTITMLMKALIDRLPDSEQRRRIGAQLQYLDDASNRRRLTLLGENQDFFAQLIEEKDPHPQTGGQKRLKRAFQRICERVAELPPNHITKWIDGIATLNVLEFVEDNEGNAIRIFETVNDRGRPLATIDKIKSFLIYVSNRYHNGDLDDPLQQCFGRVFRAFDVVKELGGNKLAIELIQPDRFTEDDVLRYHFLAYPSEFHDYKFRADEVLTLFLKPAVKQLANDPSKLRTFVVDYSEDLAKFFEALGALMQRADSDATYYKMFTSLRLSARLYPLMIRLAARNLLDQPLPNEKARTFRDAIETTDLRVYKTRGTDPAKDVACLARDAKGLDMRDIASRLATFVSGFMGDEKFKAELSGPVYRDNEGTRHILLEFDEKVKQQTTGTNATIDELKALSTKEPTIDHILAQAPTFSENNRGFNDESDYEGQMDRLGNLTLVEKSINSSAQGKSPEQKANEDKLYKASSYRSTRKLGASLAQAVLDGKTFGKLDVETRTNDLIEFCAARWALWP